MKKLITIILAFCILSCDNPAECLERTGDQVVRTVPVGPFEKIIVYRGVSMVISQGETYSVEIISGENLIDDIEAKVTNGILTLKDKTTCNWRRAYGTTTVYVTAPFLNEISCKTEQKISSGNVLTYPYLKLTSIDLTDGAGTGNFYLQLNNDEVFIETNNVSGFYLSGSTNILSTGFYEGNGPLRAKELVAQHVNIFHRGSNNMYINAVQSVQGDIYSTGNVFCYSQPPTVDVEEHYHGELFFE